MSLETLEFKPVWSCKGFEIVVMLAVTKNLARFSLPQVTRQTNNFMISPNCHSGNKFIKLKFVHGPTKPSPLNE